MPTIPNFFCLEMGSMVAAFRGVSSSWPKMGRECHDVFYAGRSWDGTTQVGNGTVKLKLSFCLVLSHKIPMYDKVDKLD